MTRVWYFLRRSDGSLLGPFPTKEKALTYAEDCKWLNPEVVPKNVRTD